ncbi:glycosyltransferase family 2 protein [Winogradskyella sediminis]|uniref:glycosyltransferase family 2 protein n=1 Tax=Winogradskyella sediminis TaxID=1382466 RepID=UPI003AA8BEBE
MTNPIKPLVSVSVVTYNHVKYIKQCLDGILMQKTSFPFEIILGEDDSSDGTRAICKDYAERFPNKIRLFLRSRKDVIKINGKPTGRFNFMENLKACQGKYIAFCDGDDYWTDPFKLQKQVDFLERNPNYSICIHPCAVLNEKSKKLSKQALNLIDYEYTIRNLLSYWRIATASVVIKRDENVSFPEWFTEVASGDIALLMLYYESGKIKLLRDYMSVYRITGNGVSQYHQKYRMIHYRAKLYSYLNEFFEYKYEKEIYDALNFVYNRFSKTKEKNKKQVDKEVKTGASLIFRKVKAKLKKIFK